MVDIKARLVHGLCAVTLAFAGAGRVTAQDVPHISAADSARLRVEVLRLALGNTTTDPTAQTIWVVADTSGESTSPFRLSSRETAAMVRAYPRVRIASPTDNLYLCPPGRVVRIPGSGCPIREKGVIVRIGHLRTLSDSLLVIANVTKGIRSGSNLQSEGFGFVFGWVRGAWKYRGISRRIVT